MKYFKGKKNYTAYQRRSRKSWRLPRWQPQPYNNLENGSLLIDGSFYISYRIYTHCRLRFQLLLIRAEKRRHCPLPWQPANANPDLTQLQIWNSRATGFPFFWLPLLENRLVVQFTAGKCRQWIIAKRELLLVGRLQLWERGLEHKGFKLWKRRLGKDCN